MRKTTEFFTINGSPMLAMAVFTVLALRESISADNAMIIISMVVSFYFGTQSEKKNAA